jgi:diacylglycerol O-acyltransferase / wax synthase
MRQLSGHDASFLYSDSPHANSNITFVQIYDQRSVAGGKLRFKRILAHIESRLHRSPVFRSKLLRVPVEMDYPYWVDDEHFDLEYHVRHIALPAPGDWRQFCIQASRIHARALDLNRPLWEIYVIEGLDSITDLPRGSFALLTKIHHAAVDVQGRHDIIDVLHDPVALPALGAPPEPWFAERPPGTVGLLCRAGLNAALSPRRWFDPVLRLVPAAVAFAKDVLRPEYPQTATRFNAVVSPHRVFDTRRFTLDEFQRIRALVEGATVNDAVLAVCAGGLRRYLGQHGELPQAADLAAIAPQSITGADRLLAGKERPPWLHLQLGTALADPVQRLARISEQTSSDEALARAQSDDARTRAEEQISAATLALASRWFGHAAVIAVRGMPHATCTVSDVPAPKGAAYLCGARMTYFSAILPIADGMGLVFSVTAYDGKVIVSATSCRELMPDPQDFMQCVRDSFQEYLALADGTEFRPGPVAPAPRSAAPRASASGRSSPSRRAAGKAATAPRAARGDRPRSTAPRG